MSNNSAGVFFYSVSTNRFLYLLRADNKSPTWSIPGGGIEKDETLLEGIERECIEEMGFYKQDFKLIPIRYALIFLNLECSKIDGSQKVSKYHRLIIDQYVYS